MDKDDSLQKKGEGHLIDQTIDDRPAGLVEVTTYIREDQALALELIQNAERQKRGERCDQSELFQEALDLLIKDRLILIRLRKERLIKKNG